MDALGRGIALLAGGWYILERWGKYVWEDGPDILR
jgi:hypothetical protein